MSGLLALIPARGQSKGIPRKNIRSIAGKPLIAWTIEAALRCSEISAVVVSTEDDEVAEVARSSGAQTPFVRPMELATDGAPGVGPVLHAMAQLPGYDELLLLQPTSPLRGVNDIRGIIRQAREAGAGSMVSICEADGHPAWMFSRQETGVLQPFLDGDRPARRQDMQELFTLNGAMYYATRDWLEARQSLFGDQTLGYVMSVESSIDIDTPFDWRIAELLLADLALTG